MENNNNQDLEYNYWENKIKSKEDYKLYAMSVFATENNITKELENIANKEKKKLLTLDVVLEIHFNI